MSWKAQIRCHQNVGGKDCQEGSCRHLTFTEALCRLLGFEKRGHLSPVLKYPTAQEMRPDEKNQFLQDSVEITRDMLRAVIRERGRGV